MLTILQRNQTQDIESMMRNDVGESGADQMSHTFSPPKDAAIDLPYDMSARPPVAPTPHLRPAIKTRDNNGSPMRLDTADDLCYLRVDH